MVLLSTLRNETLNKILFCNRCEQFILSQPNILKKTKRLGETNLKLYSKINFKTLTVFTKKEF